VFVVGMAASAAHAQCDFQHPKKASKLQSNLVQAFVSCNNPGGNTPNNTTGGGIPSCSPPETFSNQAGNCNNGGWVWRRRGCVGGANGGANCTVDSECPASTCGLLDAASSGQIAFKALKHCLGVSTGTALPPCIPSSPLNTGPPVAADLDVKLKLKKILDCGTGDYVNGVDGTLATLSRATLNDNTNGDQTVIDFSAQFPFHMVNGAANLHTSADAVLNFIGNAGLPPCTSIEVVGIRILDANNDAFADLGTYLPEP